MRSRNHGGGRIVSGKMIAKNARGRRAEIRNIVLREMSDGKERTTNEMKELIDSPSSNSVAGVLRNLAHDLTVERSPVRLKSRSEKQATIWRLESK